MIEDVGLDVLPILAPFQEKHLGARGVHLQEVGIRLLIEVPPTADEAVVQPIQFFALLRVLHPIVRLVVVEAVIALADFDVRLEARDARERQVYRVENRAAIEVGEVADLSILDDDRTVAQVAVGLRKEGARTVVERPPDFRDRRRSRLLGVIQQVEK